MSKYKNTYLPLRNNGNNSQKQGFNFGRILLSLHHKQYVFYKFRFIRTIVVTTYFCLRNRPFLTEKATFRKK